MPGIDDLPEDFTWDVWHHATFAELSVDPDEVSALLGLEPTVVRRHSDAVSEEMRVIRRAEGLPDTSCRWSIETEERTFGTADKNRAWDEDLNALIVDLHARMDAVRALCPPAELYFRTVIYTDSCMASVGLSPEINRLVVELGAEWGATIWFCNQSDEMPEE